MLALTDRGAGTASNKGEKGIADKVYPAGSEGGVIMKQAVEQGALEYTIATQHENHEPLNVVEDGE